MCATKRKEMAARTTRISVGLPPRVALAQGPSQSKKSPRLKRIPAWKARDKHGEQQRERIHLQQDTQAVGRSDCFLFHSDSVARMGFCPKGLSQPENPRDQAAARPTRESPPPQSLAAFTLRVAWSRFQLWVSSGWTPARWILVSGVREDSQSRAFSLR